MKPKLLILITFLLSASTTIAWYPEYSVMASDLVLGQQFMAPAQYHSMMVYSLGEGFRDIYNSPIDNFSSNPAAAFELDKRHFFQLDLGDQHLFDDNNAVPSTSSRSYGYDSYISLPWSWYQQTEEKEDYKPLMRLIYLGYPLKVLSNTRLGVTFDWVYEISQFYEPINYWGLYDRDALGSNYEKSAEDPYDDYRLREAGDDENVNQGYHASFSLAHPINPGLDIGLRFSLANEAVDGDLRDYNHNTQSDYYDEYVSLYESQKERLQDFKSSDVMLGIESHRQDGSHLGISAGRLTGKLDRMFNEQDSSNYYALKYDRYPEFTLDDSIAYINSSSHLSEKSWVYDGQTWYGGVQYRSANDNGRQYKFSLYGENRVSDLVESESMNQHSNYESRYFSYYDTSLYEYASNSWARVERTGTGKFEHSVYRGSGGIDWTVSPNFRFLGGIFINLSDRQHSAFEPFEGEKYAYNSRSGYYSYSGTDIYHQDDIKDFSWTRTEQELTLGLPVGFILNFGEFFQLSSSLTKIFRKIDITEQYDVIVHRYYHTQDRNGIITITDDSSYVDGYEFPDIKEFENGFDLNAGLSFVFADNFSATVAFTSAFTDDYSVKLGARLSW